MFWKRIKKLKCPMSLREGFTLIELVIIIVILGILAAVAIPRYYSLVDEAEEAAEAGVVGGVRGGIHTYYANCKNFPAALDGAGDGNCATDNVCFDEVLEFGIMKDWTKSVDTYTGPAEGTYTYYPATGGFR